METNLSILMFPWLAHGHVFPHLELAKNLSNKNFKVFFCSTPIILSSITDALKDNVSIHLVEFHLISSPELPPHYHTTKNVPPNLVPKLHEAFQNSSSIFSTIIGSLKPDMLIYDIYQPWAPRIASSLGIPAVYFSTSGATANAFYNHLFTQGNSAFPYDSIYLRDFESKAIQAVADSLGKSDQDLMFGHFTQSCEIVLMKTCRGLEGKYLDYLSVLYQQKMVPVGPLVGQAESEENHSEMMQWLSKKDRFSTVLISFGSQNYLSKDQMGEMAKGLEVSNANFIWVVRFPHGERLSVEEVLPEGFLDRVKERGMIVQGWAPQKEILAHPSIGAFVSHCGMSSVFESIYFGVPVIAVPLKLDQPINARLMVEANVGLEVIRDENGNLSSSEIANSINKVVFGKTGEDMRLKASELSETIKSEEENALNEVVEQLQRICLDHKQK